MTRSPLKYPADWSEISKRIRFERAGNRCEWCGAENGKPHPITGSRVVLTVAHLGVPLPDGQPGDRFNTMDCRDENLAALCQRDHLNYDRPFHVRTRKRRAKKRRETTIKRKPVQLSLFSS